MEVVKEAKLKGGKRVLATLQMADFLITYYGINMLGVITEANPLQVFLFEINLIPALIVRAVCIYLIYKILEYLQSLSEKHYRGVIVLAILGNIYVMYLHYSWINIYLKY